MKHRWLESGGPLYTCSTILQVCSTNEAKNNTKVKTLPTYQLPTIYILLFLKALLYVSKLNLQQKMIHSLCR